ncbi:AraC family transcriptional regulator, regulatory protein of adaptative response / methylated-DNA-[protein]-cysteine methyltransferase [Amphritea atlantica]|uniref:AraC family transcriptional regulator, regulatory protein of adaptative response / methylated-DNA-[protein]-cysteine methyltransferase n=1 Tax=Amphritea atlantica TaxID=355243 RepID=A0A1H9K025_9GAMM|nr:methylated-DNA--[protein]-cysteine S-methyltransferase [Amphritea atlantica]SEQ92377.1 AraC family transcriptional regulator, regulatory protein of adaptative response / methylated-DNA-[protein]-cysteine methyltransferase [Amphritea atlantica]
MSDRALQQYKTVATAIRYIRQHAKHQPELAEVAAAVHMSEHHLQRIFSAWAGISPKRFLQYLTKEHALSALKASTDSLTAAHDAGLSGGGRLHDLMISCEAMTPGEIRTGGTGVKLHYGVAVSPFGLALAGWTPRGLCYLAFLDEDRRERQAELLQQWPNATIIADDCGAEAMMEKIFPTTPQPGKLHLLLRGTNFQIKVWQALLHTHPGQFCSYSQLAVATGSPKAQRAIGSALAANSIGYLIPCHRVIRESGDSGHYRWGAARKQAIHSWEYAHATEQPDT